MKFEHKTLLELMFKRTDSIGIWEVDLDEFSYYTDRLITAKDISISDFVADVNNDGKDRMKAIDNNRKLWFTPTIIFQHGNNKGSRYFNKSDRDASIVNTLSMRESTREWFINELTYNERLTIDTELLKKMAASPVSDLKCKQFVRDIAKAIGFKMPIEKDLPSHIKAEFGHMCAYCGNVFEDHDLQIDHIVPQTEKLPDKLKKFLDWRINKAPACQNCNVKKGTKSVFLFMKEEGFKWLPGLENKVAKLAKKALLDYPTHYPLKNNKKEKFYTYEEVQRIHFNNLDNRKMKDFEITNQVRNEKKLWKMKSES